VSSQLTNTSSPVGRRPRCFVGQTEGDGLPSLPRRPIGTKRQPHFAPLDNSDNSIRCGAHSTFSILLSHRGVRRMSSQFDPIRRDETVLPNIANRDQFIRRRRSPTTDWLCSTYVGVALGRSRQRRVSTPTDRRLTPRPFSAVVDCPSNIRPSIVVSPQPECINYLLMKKTSAGGPRESCAYQRQLLQLWGSKTSGCS